MMAKVAAHPLIHAAVTLFLCGDVMTGRGIDQILPDSVEPRLYEPYVKDARTYVRIAEERTGPIPKEVSYGYLWGEALRELERRAPEARLINLETAVTDGGRPWPGKGIHYRMHPANVPVLTAAGIDMAVLANNHVLDWEYTGLEQTLASLHRAGIRTAGAGADAETAEAPAVLEFEGGGRLLVFAWGVASSGIPEQWAATGERPGVNLLPDLSAATVRRLTEKIRAFERPGDLVLVSLHWGDNWGYEVPSAHRRFARALIDEAGVDLVHGHSSHHPRPIEVHDGRLILYGCGDFINDYEGISGHEEYRPELTIMYFPVLERKTGRLRQLRMIPLRIRHFRLERAEMADLHWLEKIFNREGRRFGTRVEQDGDGSLLLTWD